MGLARISPRVSRRSIEERTQGEVGFESLKATLFNYPRQYVGVGLEVILEFTSRNLFAVWLLLNGVSPLFVTSLYGIRIASTIAAAPLINRLVVRQRGEEFLGAAFLGVSGWVLLILFPSGVEVVALVSGSFLLGISSFLFITGLESRWYSRRSITQILMRELVLSVVRLFSIPLLSWLVFFDPFYFAVLALVMCAAQAPYGRWLMTSSREREV